jgi:hypothetical protein
MSPITPAARLQALREQAMGGTVTLGAVAERLGHAATGTLLLLCGLAGLVPGLAVVLGVPLCLLAMGLLLGREEAWLPHRSRTHSIKAHRLVTAIDRVVPWLRWLERWLRPRAAWVMSGAGRRAIGLAALICGMLIMLPVPFGNTAPAVAVIVLAVGMIARDGVMVLAGLGCAFGALVLDTLLLVAGYQAVQGLAGWIA